MSPSKERQIDKFKQAARELETDESEEAFDRALKKVAKMPTKRVPPKRGCQDD